MEDQDLVAGSIRGEPSDGVNGAAVIAGGPQPCFGVVHSVAFKTRGLNPDWLNCNADTLTTLFKHTAGSISLGFRAPGEGSQRLAGRVDMDKHSNRRDRVLEQRAERSYVVQPQGRAQQTSTPPTFSTSNALSLTPDSRFVSSAASHLKDGNLDRAIFLIYKAFASEGTELSE